MPTAPSNPTRHTRGYAVAVVSAIILSTTALFISHLNQAYGMPALVLAFWRALFVMLTLLPVLGLLRPGLLRVASQHVPYLAAYGLVLAIFNGMWTLSVTWNGAAVATVLVYCSAAFTALLGRWLLGERLTWARILAIVVCLSGTVLVSEALDPAIWRTNLINILLGVLSGLLYAVYSLMGRSAAQRGLNPWTTLLYTFGFAAAFLLVFNLLPGGFVPGAAPTPAGLFWLGDAWAGWGLLLVLAAVPSVTGFGLYNVSLSLLPSGVANLILTLEPPFTAGFAYLLLGERLNEMQLAGSLLILSGVVLLHVLERRPVGKRLAREPVQA